MKSFFRPSPKFRTAPIHADAASPRWQPWRHASLGTALSLWSLHAAAACLPTEVGGSLGTQPSQRVRNGPVISTTAEFRLGCGATVLAALSTPKLQGKITSATTSLTLKNTLNSSLTVPYGITKLGGGTLTQGLLVIDLLGAQAIGVLNNAYSAMQIQITTLTGANVPAGIYTDTITANWTYQDICEGGLAVGGLCILGNMRSGNVDRTITVQLVVTNDCTITAPDIQFGSAPLPGGFGTVSQSIGLLCTKGMTYTVGLSLGNNPGSGRRQMANGSNRLQYNIYKPDKSVWGDTGTARANGIGVSDGATLQTMPYSASIYADQPAASLGTYTDSVRVDVQF